METVIPRFLPYSFRGRFPASPRLTRLYLRTPLAWRLLERAPMSFLHDRRQVRPSLPERRVVYQGDTRIVLGTHGEKPLRDGSE